MLADDLAEIEKIFVAQLDRFLDSETISSLSGYNVKRSEYSNNLDEMVVQIGTATVRADWKRNSKKPVQDGIVLRDGSVVTALITVKEIAKNWKPENLSPIASIIKLFNRLEEPWAVISDYSFSFYPIDSNKKARALGYFRCGFHPAVLGDDKD
jgi:hypothetical protein